MFPRKVVKANLSMNAAFAQFWSVIWNDASLTLPYKASGYANLGSRLMAISDSISSSPDADQSLIDAWAFELGLKGWYSAVPHILHQ